METTDKYSCQVLADLLVAHGVEHVVLSPGSRDLPLMLAVHRTPRLKSTVVVDERVAAFVALGMASVSGKPTAVVCTSGTALLNYAPAVAEAYYRHIPMVVISADRPYHWIDQDDSQTIRQHGALEHIVKRSCDIPDARESGLDRWYAGRMINDALIEMQRGCPGPVHINIQLTEPLNGLAEKDGGQAARFIHYGAVQPMMMPDCLNEYAEKILHSPKVMIVAGFMSPELALEVTRSLQVIEQLPNVVILTESISNLKLSGAVQCIDMAVSGIPDSGKADFAPDLLITVGGALVSRFVKQFLRTNTPAEHWHIGHTRVLVDCMQAMTMHVDMSPDAFFSSLSALLEPEAVMHKGYATMWHDIYAAGLNWRDNFLSRCGWCDLEAFSLILPHIPEKCNLQLSNGTPIRYAQLMADMTHVNSVDCNRGVSGIDGSTSTAVGASMIYDGPTLLITGDMSAQYDVGALALKQIPDRFRMIVINNGGGGIFRFIGSTSAVEEREQFFGEAVVNLPLQQLAEAYGFAYFVADDAAQLRRMLPLFFASAGKSILEIRNLPQDQSAYHLRELLHMNK